MIPEHHTRSHERTVITDRWASYILGHKLAPSKISKPLMICGDTKINDGHTGAQTDQRPEQLSLLDSAPQSRATQPR